MRTLFPRTDKVSKSTVFCPLMVILAFFKWVFIATSTPAQQKGASWEQKHARAAAEACTRRMQPKGQTINIPVIVPWIWVPFLSSMVIVSPDSFIKNLWQCLGEAQGREFCHCSASHLVSFMIAARI